MESDDKRLYEGLFLLRQEAVTVDFQGCVDFLRHVFDRANAEVLVLRRWEERRLAYDIRGQRRGVFLLAYFKAAGPQLANIERDCRLSDQILRTLVIKADHIGETELELAAKDAALSLEAKLRAPETETAVEEVSIEDAGEVDEELDVRATEEV